MTFDDLKRFSDEYLVAFGVKLVSGLAIFVIGRWVVKLLLRGFDRVLQRGRVDVSLRKFLGDTAYAGLFVVLSLAALDTIGVRTTSLVAVLGGAALAVGLALQGALSNFAAGVMLLVLRPYKVNDWVVIGKYTGRVEAIRVVHTVLITADRREITIPNGQILAGPIENHSAVGDRRVDLCVTVPTATDLGALRRVLLAALSQDDRIAANPPVAIDVGEVQDNGIKVLLRPWTRSDDHFRVMVESMERVQSALVAAGIKGTVGSLPSLIPGPPAS